MMFIEYLRERAGDLRLSLDRGKLHSLVFSCLVKCEAFVFFSACSCLCPLAQLREKFT